MYILIILYIVVVQLLSPVQLFVTPWNATRQSSLSFTVSQSLLKLMSTELMMSSNHLILFSPLLLLPSVFPIIRVFSNELGLHIRWPKYWSFNFFNLSILIAKLCSIVCKYHDGMNTIWPSMGFWVLPRLNSFEHSSPRLLVDVDSHFFRVCNEEWNCWVMFSTLAQNVKWFPKLYDFTFLPAGHNDPVVYNLRNTWYFLLPFLNSG